MRQNGNGKKVTILYKHFQTDLDDFFEYWLPVEFPKYIDQQDGLIMQVPYGASNICRLPIAFGGKPLGSLEAELRQTCMLHAQDMRAYYKYLVVECCIHENILYYSQITELHRTYLTICGDRVDILRTYLQEPTTIYKASVYCIYADNSLFLQSVFDGILTGNIVLTAHDRLQYTGKASTIAECADFMESTVSELIRSINASLIQ